MSDPLVLTWPAGLGLTMPLLLLQTIVGLGLSVAIAWVAYRRNSLSQSGAFAAVVVGTIIFALGGPVWGLVLVAFFVSSSVLSHYRTPQKDAVADHFAKTGCRDLGQVAANGGLGALLAALFALTGSSQPLFFYAFVGAMAAVNADTWATELGVMSPIKPRLITSRETVEPGTSGGVSWLGVAASLAGAWAMGFLALLLQIVQGWVQGEFQVPRVAWLPLIATVGGLAGSLFDSLLGATVQATYYCPQCGKETERPIHRCGRQPIYIRGWHWLDNDWVNLLASLAGALVTAGLGALVLYIR